MEKHTLSICGRRASGTRTLQLFGLSTSFQEHIAMKPVKRLEIITGPIEFRSLVQELEAAGVTGYAVIRNVLGKGDRKVNSWDSLSSELENLLVVTTVSEEHLMPLVETIRPVLRKFGGSCLVSDAMWVIH